MKGKANEWKLQLIKEVISLSDEEALTAILSVQPDATTKSHGGTHPPGPPPPPPDDD